MAAILPAILEQTKNAFRDKASAITRIGGVTKIHVDFADGKFVPNRMLDIAEFDPLNPAFEWEAHLMIQSPGDFLDYQIAGFKKVIVHYEAFASPDDLRAAALAITKLGLTPAVAINPGTEVGKLAECRVFSKEFTLMGVVPGFQGAPFVAETYQRLNELRKLLPDAILEVDGSVKLHNVSDLARAGADLLVVGSGLWTDGNPGDQVLKLQQAAQQAAASK